MPLFRASLPFITTLSITVPATGILIATYLYNRPLGLPKSRTISTTYDPSSSFSIFPRSLEIVNPRNHQARFDTRSITLLKSEFARKESDKSKYISDEEILASFVKGFFGGWSFTPERGMLAMLRNMGRKFIEAKFSKISPRKTAINTLDGLSKTKLLPKGTLLFGGNFLILDIHISPNSVISASKSLPELAPASVFEPSRLVSNKLEDPNISYIDVGFGSNERDFSGVHRFEVKRHPAAQEERKEEVTICFSSMSCNPSSNKPPFPNAIFKFHCWYAMSLFRDGIEGVICG